MKRKIGFIILICAAVAAFILMAVGILPLPSQWIYHPETQLRSDMRRI